MAKTDEITESWAPRNIAAILRASRTGDRVAALKRMGILDKDGQLAKKYRSWGKKPSRTPSASEMLRSW